MERTSRRNAPAPPALRARRLPELTGGKTDTLPAHGTYDALRFTGDGLTGVDLTGVDLTAIGITDCVVED